MKAYTASGGDPHECAILVFAHNAREAKRIAWPTVRWMCECEYMDMRVKILGGPPYEYLFEYADKAKLAANEPHVIDSIPCCESCEQWGQEGGLDMNGHCEDCAEEARENAEYEATLHAPPPAPAEQTREVKG